MTASVESANKKINEKISIGKAALYDLRPIVARCTELAAQRTGKKAAGLVEMLHGIHLNLLLDGLECIEEDYSLAVVSVLSDYYADPHNESRSTREYYRTIASENYCGKIDQILTNIGGIIDTLYKVLAANIMPRGDTRNVENDLEVLSTRVTGVLSIEISMTVERRNFETCKCGTRMTIIPELSDMICPSESCGRTKKIIGAVFRDDQFYPQEGQKTKHGGYDELRHYKFWIERLQALEKKTFTEDELRRINYVIKRDGFDRRRELDCEVMREILKDPDVQCTHLNEHVPLLVKTCGGRAPPQISFQNNKILEALFIMVMKLYDEIISDGGNKPYYPYFIYKLIESRFANDRETSRLLEFIHLQNRETVVKNDLIWEQICAATAETENVLSYIPTDPARNF